MNKPLVERVLSRLQMALIPLALFVILLGIVFDANAADDDASPSMELLEFLGEWQTKDGEWVDPMRFLDVSEKDLEMDPHATVNVNEVTRDD
ncbi:MAG: hypothetical protein L0Z73_18095 [Gammaproteobacteria bacterium]|nr:hypothetical protein [Gammaproteobacteria bacterium]